MGDQSNAIVRVAPDGVPLDDGYSTKISIADRSSITAGDGTDLSIDFWEKVSGIPGIDGGEAIETTTMLNSAWRTYAPRSLKTLTEFTVTGAYDTQIYLAAQILALINIETIVTVTFPDDATLSFYAYVRMIEFADAQEGTHPEATLTIRPTNTDYHDGSEQSPNLAGSAGT